MSCCLLLSAGIYIPGKMSAPQMPDSMFSWYEDAHEDFKSRFSPSMPTGFSEYFFRKQQELGLDKREVFLSIGPGVGDIDVKVLPAHTHLRLYLAVEPNPKSCESLEKKLQNEIPFLAHQIINKKVEDWEGPRSPVDIIFASHSLYYCPDPKLILERLLSWLKPGGLLITTLDGRCQMSGKLPEQFILENGKRYADPDLLADLKAIGANIVDEEKVSFTVDFRNVTRDLANFLQHKLCDENDVKELGAHMKRKFESGYMQNKTTVRVVQKK